MSLSLENARLLIRVLLPHVELESALLYPFTPEVDRSVLRARTVFDTIRQMCEPPITEEEFNRYADEQT